MPPLWPGCSPHHRSSRRYRYRVRSLPEPVSLVVWRLKIMELVPSSEVCTNFGWFLYGLGRQWIKGSPSGFHPHGEGEDLVFSLGSNLPAAFAGKIQSCGLEAGWVAARNVGLHGRRVSVQSLACDFQVSAGWPEPAYLDALFTGSQVGLILPIPPGRGPHGTAIINIIIPISRRPANGRIVRWDFPGWLS